MSGLGLLMGCCSAEKPCSFQREFPGRLCDVCHIASLREPFQHATSEDWDYLNRLLVVSVRHQQDEETKFWLSVMKELRFRLTTIPT